MDNQTIITLLIVGIVISKTLIGVLIYFLIRKNRLLKSEQFKLAAANTALHEQAQRIRHYNQELKIAENFKTKVLSIASHDLRAPFASVEVLLTINDISLIEKEDLSLIFTNLKGQVARSRKMLEEVLRWTDAQLRDKLENTETCNILDQINDLLEMYRLELQKSKMLVLNTVDRNFSVDIHKEIFCFVVRNVISNATKYGRTGGKIQILLRDNTVDHWELTIINDGDELSPEVLYHLNFVNSWERKKAENKNGAGLGISLCRDLLKRINGSLQFANSSGEGVSVKLMFPRKRIGA
ncbi:sensor histidine kinase [Sphingobacterium puteale]|uniref:histidine kinase n=1 Tax=Sphingobacterium puteale TaxID=2420510 RepID=A0A420VUJ3_9SPHI|nr:HAMP domain-containing sensor histidine kinase [Sphingobacterium puteale]RKO69889.1 sensor histidine kinase [Sphingobacterium puteale]